LYVTGEERRALTLWTVKSIEDSILLCADRGGNDKVAVSGFGQVRWKRRSLRLSWREGLHSIAGAKLCKDNRNSRTQIRA
jgi:hypothetical protein